MSTLPQPFQLNTVGWVATAIIVILLYQSKTARPYVILIVIVLLIGIGLRFWPTIYTQIQSIGGKKA